MRTITLAAVPVLLLTIAACVEDVGKDKVAATVEDAPAEATKTEAAPVAGTPLVVDPAKSSIRAVGAKVTAEHPIDFKTFKGTVTVDGETVTAVEFAVEMASLEADHPKLTGHLKNEDFFHVEKFPKATFASTAVKAGAEADATAKGFTHTVSGDLTLHGQTKRITFPATIEVGSAEVSAKTEFVLNRQDFGVTYPGRPDDLVQDNVRMTIAFVAPRQG